MGKILLGDFLSQKKNLTVILLMAIPAAVVGFAFQSIYYCVGIAVTAGLSIIYFNCFFDYLISMMQAENQSREERDSQLIILRKKMQVRTKYVEIVIVSAFMYVIMSVAYLLDSLDRNRFADPMFYIIDHIQEIMLFPITFVLTVSVFTPLLFRVKINKTLFTSLAVISILIPYGVFLLDFFFNFTENQILMGIIPSAVVGMMLLSLFISLAAVIRRK